MTLRFLLRIIWPNATCRGSKSVRTVPERFSQTKELNRCDWYTSIVTNLRPTTRTSVMSHHGPLCRTIVLDVVRVFAIMDGGRRSDPMLCRQRGAAETRQLPEISRRERRRCECITPSGLFHGSLYSCYQRSLKSNHLRSGDGYMFKTHRRSAGSPSVTSGSAANPPIL